MERFVKSVNSEETIIGIIVVKLREYGKSWEKFYPFGEGKSAIIRSLFHDPQSGRVYLGAFREFGYFEYDDFGEMKFTSLLQDSGIEAGDNDEIWYITKIGSQIFFIYFTSYYIYDTDTGEIHRNDASTSFFYSPDDYLYLVPGSATSARRYSGKSFSYDVLPALKIDGGSILKVFLDKNAESNGIGQKPCAIAVTTNEGLYRLEGEKHRRIDKTGDSWGIANRAILCEDGTIIVGFISGGVWAFNENGDLLWKISMENGLIDNTVLALMEDDCGNIWCALDKGIAVIFKDGDRIMSLSGYGLGKTTVSLKSGENLYVGSNQGLVRFKMDENLGLEKVGSYFQDSPLWSLYEQDGQVFIGENSSSYIFSDGVMQRLSDAPGGAKPKAIRMRDGSEMLIQGSFTSLYVYKRENGRWRFSHTVEGFMRPVKNLEVDYLGNIWIEHMYQGLYRLTLSDDGKRVTGETVFPIDDMKVCKMGGRVLFHNTDGFFYYDERDSELKPFDLINNAAGEYRDCNRVIDTGGDRYWLTRKKDAAYISCHNDEAAILDIVNFKDFNVSMTERFETILSISGDRFLFGVEDGFLIHDLRKEKDSESVEESVRLSGIKAYYDNSIHPLSIKEEKIVLPNNSGLKISLCMSGVKYHNADIMFELVPYDYAPRLMDADMTASYQRLQSGSYSFHAWIDDENGGSIADLYIPVVVKPSPFLSPVSILVYILIAIALLYLAYFEVQRMMKRQKARLESEKEKEIITLRNEQLEESVLLKSKELATYSIIEARRNQVLQKLREELGKIRFGKPGSISKSDYDALMQIIHEGEFSENNWSHFYNNFDLIHKSFFRILTESHPDLTPNDLRICAYLRLNMSTKELADVMGVTVKGAEAAKYRLRKKLGVDTSIPLSEYLTKIGK
ncbi:MAG: hypothetical protein ACI4TM_04790 [Candidatus Cryptobacteroides sp.]